MEENKIFADNMLRLMHIHNISEKELAEKTHVSTPTVVAWIKGEKLPYSSVMGALTAALCCSEADLYGGKVPETDMSIQQETGDGDRKEELQVAGESGTVQTDETGTRAARDTAPAKKAAVKKAENEKKTGKPSLTQAGNKDEVINAMRLMKRNVKVITKSMSADDAKSWVDQTIEAVMNEAAKSIDAYTSAMNDCISSLVAISLAGIDGSFKDGLIVEERYKELLSAACGAPDEALATAVMILKNWKK